MLVIISKIPVQNICVNLSFDVNHVVWTIDIMIFVITVCISLLFFDLVYKFATFY